MKLIYNRQSNDFQILESNKFHKNRILGTYVDKNLNYFISYDSDGNLQVLDIF